MSYRILKRQFALDDEALDDLKYELIEVDELAVDKDGKMLVWAAATPVPSAESHVPRPPQPPIPNPQFQAAYMPQHLAERIRAEQAAMESRGAADGERKTITALFADLKGSTALIEGLDPEDARAIMSRAQRVIALGSGVFLGFVSNPNGPVSRRITRLMDRSGVRQLAPVRRRWPA